MSASTFAATVATLAVFTTPGRRVARRQESVATLVDDASITSTVKGRYMGSKDVDVTSIGVDTLDGTVMLSGFAGSPNEKATAGSIAMKVDGVKSVQNMIAVRP